MFLGYTPNIESPKSLLGKGLLLLQQTFRHLRYEVIPINLGRYPSIRGGVPRRFHLHLIPIMGQLKRSPGLRPIAGTGLQIGQEFVP